MSEKKQSPFSFIARLFWPRKAVALANKFEAEGTANKEAISYYEWVAYKYCLLCVLIIPGAMWACNSRIMAVIMLVASPLVIWWALRDDFYRFIIILSLGKRTPAVISKFKFVGKYGGQRIYYKIDSDQSEVKMSYHLPIYHKRHLPQVGDSAVVYYYPEGKKFKVVPDLPALDCDSLSLKEKYSFTTNDATPS